MKKYKVTQEFIDALEDWREKFYNGDICLNFQLLNKKINVIENWRFYDFRKDEQIKRFGALVNWINGEDVFEIGTPIYVVRLKGVFPEYIRIETNGYVNVTYYIQDATRFDDLEKASEWANVHFEVVEVDE